MPPEVRQALPHEHERVLAWIAGAFGGAPGSQEETAELFSLFEPERVLVAADAAEVVGGAAALTLSISVPGGDLQCAGVTVVSVSPTHRRQGLLTRMTRALLDGARERGEPLAALFASEGSIYGRYGFGMTEAMAIEAERDRIVFRDPPAPGISFRPLAHEEAVRELPTLWERSRGRRGGMLARDAAWWDRHRLQDSERARRGAGPLQRVLLLEHGEPMGYALYRIRGAFERHAMRSAVEVVEALGASDVAIREVWRHVCSIDLTATVRSFFLPVDHPLPLLVTEPARLHCDLADGLWLRLVDAEAALRARSWPGAAPEVVLELRDAFCPWNDGRYRLPGGERVEAAPDLRLDAEALASLYLGGSITPTRLAVAGRLEELTRGAARRADAAFAVPLAPWSPEVF